MRLSAFETYALFNALKLHFTTESYDFFRYHGKTNVSLDRFGSNNQRFNFQKLSRKVDGSEMQDYLVSNFLEGKTWVKDFMDSEAEDIYKDFLRRKQSISYTFASEVGDMFHKHGQNIPFQNRLGVYPFIIERYLNKELSLETLAILNYLVQFSKKFDVSYGKDDIIWGKLSLLIRKYYPFIEYDKKKIIGILKEKMDENPLV